ncbi:MAG: hypothetical protein ABEI77_05290 [Halorientalis sp.]
MSNENGEPKRAEQESDEESVDHQNPAEEARREINRALQESPIIDPTGGDMNE